MGNAAAQTGPAHSRLVESPNRESAFIVLPLSWPSGRVQGCRRTSAELEQERPESAAWTADPVQTGLCFSRLLGPLSARRTVLPWSARGDKFWLTQVRIQSRVRSPRCSSGALEPLEWPIQAKPRPRRENWPGHGARVIHNCVHLYSLCSSSCA